MTEGTDYGRTPGHRSLTSDEQAAIRAVREAGQAYVMALNEHLPQGRQKSLAITNAQQSEMWATASIVGNHQ